MHAFHFFKVAKRKREMKEKMEEATEEFQKMVFPEKDRRGSTVIQENISQKD